MADCVFFSPPPPRPLIHAHGHDKRLVYVTRHIRLVSELLKPGEVIGRGTATCLVFTTGESIPSANMPCLLPCNIYAELVEGLVEKTHLTWFGGHYLITSGLLIAMAL